MITSPDRQTFREAVALVAARAKASCPRPSMVASKCDQAGLGA